MEKPKKTKLPEYPAVERSLLSPALAWVFIGVGSISSVVYGPQAAFSLLPPGTAYLAVPVAAAVALTVFIIYRAYSRMMEMFPFSGGSYSVASRMIGPRAGLLAGTAVLIDSILTTTISLALCTDLLLWLIPEFQRHRIATASVLLIMLAAGNLRGLRQPAILLLPVVLLFFAIHGLLFIVALVERWPELGSLIRRGSETLRQEAFQSGWFPLFLIALYAYGIAGGTYAGIEAIWNSAALLRRPLAESGRKAMRYISFSLAAGACFFLLSYVLVGLRPGEAEMPNVALVLAVFPATPLGEPLRWLVLLSEAALLFAAAQGGFVSGGRSMATMAADSWLPHRFSSLSERLAMHNGIVFLTAVALGLLVLTKGSVRTLVVMYALNVAIPFALSQFGMIRLLLSQRFGPHVVRHVALHAAGLLLRVIAILAAAVQKFARTGLIIYAITLATAACCAVIRSHYRRVEEEGALLDEMFIDLPLVDEPTDAEPDPLQPTALQLVKDYNGFGIGTLLSVVTAFPGTFRTIIFVSVAVIDLRGLKGEESMARVTAATEEMLLKYVYLAKRLGFAADYRMAVGSDVVERAVSLCASIAEEFPHTAVFTGEVIFRQERLHHRMLHNQTAFAVQRRLQWLGITAVVMPIRVNA